MPLPHVAIVGRPNVGKSSLFNRLVGRRVAIVEPTAGVTRDRISLDVEWRGRRFELVDTGGLGLVDEVELREHVEEQIQLALRMADVVLFVVDAKAGPVPGDGMVAERLRRLNKPVVVVVNKVESRWEELGVFEWRRLGFGDPLAVSAKEGFGVSDLLDRVVELLGESAGEPTAPEELSFAVVGKRNSGKSTFINRLCGEERVIVSEIPGTTRDAVDVLFEHGRGRLRAIDTAGVRKRTKVRDAIEFFSHARATQSIRRADVVLHMFDVSQEISQVDKKLAALAVGCYKPVVLVGNKIDLADQVSLEKWDAYIRQQLPGLAFAPVSFLSARDGTNVEGTLDLLFELRDQARVEMPTARLNQVLQEARGKLAPKGRGKVPKLFYATQIRKEPPTVLVFVNEPKLFRGQYERYLGNRLREAFDCPEVPVRLVFRRREKVELEPL